MELYYEHDEFVFQSTSVLLGGKVQEEDGQVPRMLS